ncbi:Fic family protein [Kamptonema cortianum]|nr:Fic family protein [Geitlerinema splendidum]MDK3157028.1 Fic family protein [Kamptonema cortianum]
MEQLSYGRAGHYVNQPWHYRAFIPKNLPPDPPLDLAGLYKAISLADRMLARLDAAAQLHVDVETFIFMSCRREAVLSSQIEGTQSSLSDVLIAEQNLMKGEYSSDLTETLNYIQAMTTGLERLKDFPISLRLIREVHKILLTGTRGKEQSPGEFRTSQNWIGPEGGTISTATFVPPPPHEMMVALDNWEKYLHEDDDTPPLVKLAILHAQFETIHPFLDGNGRIGRLLLTFLLCDWGILERPFLYVSHTLKLNRTEYYDRLQAVRDKGDWEGWIKFFLQAMAISAQDANERMRQINNLKEALRGRIVSEFPKRSSTLHRLLDALFVQPYISANRAQQILDLSKSASYQNLQILRRMSIIEEVFVFEGIRLYRFAPYLDLLMKESVLTPETQSPLLRMPD